MKFLDRSGKILTSLWTFSATSVKPMSKSEQSIAALAIGAVKNSTIIASG